MLLDANVVREAIIDLYSANPPYNWRDELLVALGLPPVPQLKTYRVVFEYIATEQSKTIKSLGLPDNAYILVHEKVNPRS